jgi:hypothetical protein
MSKVRVSYIVDIKDVANLMLNLPPKVAVTVDPIPVYVSTITSDLPPNIDLTSRPAARRELILVRTKTATVPIDPGRGLRIVKSKNATPCDK